MRRAAWKWHPIYFEGHKQSPSIHTRTFFFFLSVEEEAVKVSPGGIVQTVFLCHRTAAVVAGDEPGGMHT